MSGTSKLLAILYSHKDVFFCISNLFNINYVLLTDLNGLFTSVYVLMLDYHHFLEKKLKAAFLFLKYV